MAEARKRVDELLDEQLPGVDEQLVFATMLRLSRGEWEMSDIVAILQWRATR